MIDSDCIASPDEIERMVSRHHEAEYAAVAGSLLNGTPRSLSGWVSYLIEFREFMPTMPKRLDWKVPTANIVYRTEVLRRYGYFEADVPMGEDLLFHWKLSSGGERILFDPAIEATHLNRTGWKKVLFYQVDLGRHSAAARRRGGLPGQILLRHPSLILIMPFVRFKNAVKWFALHDWRTLGVFLLLSPMYLLAAFFWSVGFYREVKREGQRPSG
ncbi:MAG: glycosyltransferase, partial [Nitrospirales bacterium]